MKHRLSAIAVILCICANAAFAQAPAEPEKAPSNWKKGISLQAGFSQLSLTNWAAGGSGSISLNSYIDAFTNYKKEKYIWDNEIQLGYGFIQQFDGSPLKKSDDRIILDSKFGYKMTEKLYLSTIFNFRSQFARGYKDETADRALTSAFFSPANISLGIGIDYQPWKWLSVNFAPLTGKAVIVGIEDLRTTYGNKADQVCRFDLGAQLKVNAKLEVKNFKVTSDMLFFSNYLNHPLDIKVNWDVNVEAKITKLFSVTLRTSLIYDSDIKSKEMNVRDEGGHRFIGLDGKPAKFMTAGVQFKELFSVGFAYTIGATK